MPVLIFTSPVDAYLTIMNLQSFYHHLGSIPSQNEMSSDVSRGKTKHAHAHIMPRHPRNMASVHGI